MGAWQPRGQCDVGTNLGGFDHKLISGFCIDVRASFADGIGGVWLSGLMHIQMDVGGRTDVHWSRW